MNIRSFTPDGLQSGDGLLSRVPSTAQTLTAEAYRFICEQPALAAEIARLLHKQPTVGLTARQRELVDFIQAYIAEKDIPPSFDEMREAMGFAGKSVVHRMIVALEERGYIERLPARARAIRLRRVA